MAFTPSHENSRYGYFCGNVTKSTPCPPRLVRSLHVHMRLHHNIGDGENVGESLGNGDGYAVWRDGIGRTVTRLYSRATVLSSSHPSLLLEEHVTPEQLTGMGTWSD
jgi:hypothetical protein